MGEVVWLVNHIRICFLAFTQYSTITEYWFLFLIFSLSQVPFSSREAMGWRTDYRAHGNSSVITASLDNTPFFLFLIPWSCIKPPQILRLKTCTFIFIRDRCCLICILCLLHHSRHRCAYRIRHTHLSMELIILKHTKLYKNTTDVM